MKRSPSPPRARRRRSPSPELSAHSREPNEVKLQDADPARRKERERQLALRMAEIELGAAPAKPAFDAQAEFAKLLSSRSGGVYVPPARLRALQAAASEDKSSAEYQRLSWDALRKSITGIVNRVNVANIKHVVPELFGENLVRGRGLFARSVMKAQAASLPFTPVFAALVAVINTKLPQVGELVLTRLISQFRRSFKRNDKVSWSRGSCGWCCCLTLRTRLSATLPLRSSLISSTRASHTKSLLSKFLFSFSSNQPTTLWKLLLASCVK